MNEAFQWYCVNFKDEGNSRIDRFFGFQLEHVGTEAKCIFGYASDMDEGTVQVHSSLCVNWECRSFWEQTKSGCVISAGSGELQKVLPKTRMAVWRSDVTCSESDPNRLMSGLITLEAALNTKIGDACRPLPVLSTRKKILQGSHTVSRDTTMFTCVLPCLFALKANQ